MDGIGFKVADQIAYKMGVSKESPKRISAGLIYSITTEISNGHLYIELENLKQITKNILELDLEIEQLNKLLKLALHNLYEQEKIKLISHNNKHYIALSKHYFSEKNLSEKILTLNDHKSNLDFDITKIYQDLRNKDLNNINLNSEQQEAIIACLQNKVSVITGGPGTGKTTIIKSLLNILDQNNIIYKLAAPTGRAAKRITESTKRQASTLHRLLEFDFISAQFSRNESNTLEINFLIIDEASMLDVFLAYAVLRALNLNTHLVLIGDIDQLPSVGPGNFLKDLINSDVINITKLKDIFRQAQDSLIITNAHKINQGLFPESNKNKDDNSKLNDFIFIKEDNPENLPSYLNKIIHGILPKYNINNYNSIVLSPMHKGSAGTQKLNLDLQNILNKNSQKQINFGQYNYKLNDRVMQLRNNYDKAVFNGDIGIITDINLESKALFIKYDYRTIEYSSSELDELTLAYAISIHKSQGSEYDAVIIPVFTQHFTLLQRNLIYTAITRAKKLCIFIGQPKAMAIGINNHKSLQRCTFLPEFLTTDLQAR